MYKNKNVERSVNWAKNNPERFKENQKRYNKRKRLQMTEEDHIKERSRSNKWRLEHPDKIRKWKRDYMRKRRREDPIFRDKINERKRNWDIKNKDHIKEYAKNRYYKNYISDKESRRKILDYKHERQVNLRLEVLYWYSNGEMKCKECGTSYYEFLAVDHINNNGYEHRSSGELRKYSNDIVKYLIKNNFPEGYQILCHNCNQIKRINLIYQKDTAYTRHRRKIRKLMLNKYSNNDVRCKYCKETDERCLTFHHVNGGGTKDRREKGYSSLPSYLYKHNVPIEEIEILCQNCNKSLGHYGYLPFFK